MRVRVGVDVVDAARVTESIAAFGDRYLQRVFTTEELADAAGSAEAQAASLAGRFAAKEAVFKALGGLETVPPWAGISVRRGADGRPEVQLRPDVADRAASGGVVDLDLSISHEGSLATAVAVALVDDAHTARGGAADVAG